MPRPRLVPTAVAFTLMMLGFAGPALPNPLPGLDMAKIQEVAAQEGLPVKTIRQAGPAKLQVASEGALSREAFIKRASLLAYFVFDRLKSPVTEIEFRNVEGQAEQACRIKVEDYRLYLQDRITRDEYERRLGYLDAATAMPKKPSPPAIKLPPTPEVRAIKAPIPAPRSLWSPLVGFAYGLGLNGGSYDAYQIEYGHPILRTLDVRPSLQIISPFSPVNFLGAGPMQGLSLAGDLLGTTRHDVGASGLSFDGGLGMRVAMLQDASAQTALWPALHLRLGLRWHAATVTMRYPLFSRGGDPTAGWEAGFGVSMPLDAL